MFMHMHAVLSIHEELQAEFRGIPPLHGSRKTTWRLKGSKVHPVSLNGGNYTPNGTEIRKVTEKNPHEKNTCITKE